MRLVQKSNGPLAEYESGSADDAKGAPAFFVDVGYMRGPGEISLKGEANNFEGGTLWQESVAKGQRRMRTGGGFVFKFARFGIERVFSEFRQVMVFGGDERFCFPCVESD